MRHGGRPTTTAETGVPVRRPGSPGPLGGKVFIPVIQRERLLDAAEESIAESGFGALRLHRMCARAGMSHKTFYELFADREECFLALFDRALDQLGEIARPAYEAHEEWSDRIRAALGGVLEYLEERPDRARLVFVEALGAGPRVLGRRAEILGSLAKILDEGRHHKGGGSHRAPPPLTGESVVGAVCSVIHTRVCEQATGAGTTVRTARGSREAEGSLSDLLNPLMATIVLPYRGHSAADSELLARSAPRRAAAPRSGSRQTAAQHSRSERAGARRSAPRQAGAQRSRSSGQRGPSAKNPLVDLPMRLTYRTLAVLSAISEGPGASNHEVARAAQIKDEGQTSKLLARLARLRLIENTGPGYPSGAPNEWRLTERGEELLRAVSPLPSNTGRLRGDERMEVAA